MPDLELNLLTAMDALLAEGSVARAARRLGLSASAMSRTLPVQTAPIAVSQMWHPRMDADPAHRWLRGLVHRVCQK